MSESTPLVIRFIMEFMLTPGFPLRLGAMMSTALILGFLLYQDTKDWWKWIFTGVVYLGYQEWLRIVISETVGATEQSRPVALTVIGAGVFTFSLICGAFIARKSNIKRTAFDTITLKEFIKKGREK